MPLADVRCCCGRDCLFVADIALAMEGDKCRTSSIPAELLPPIPEEELATATIGGKSIRGMDRKMIGFFRGDLWDRKMMQWVADKINEAANRLDTPPLI
jgi:hypothetical protein